MKDRQGITIVGVLVAIGLTGVIAGGGMKLINNQLAATKLVEIIDKRNDILNFYSELLRDDSVWQCVLNHKTGSNFTNTDLRDYVVNLSTSVTNGGVAIIATDCATVLVEATGRTLGDSIIEADTNGWWTVQVTWQGVGKGAVDLTLEVSIDRSKFNAQHSSKVNQPIKSQTIKVHRSENATQGSCRGSDYEEAVISIALHTAANNRMISCSGSDYRIVQLATRSGCTGAHPIGNITAKGEIICSTGVTFRPQPPAAGNFAFNGLSASGIFTKIATRVLLKDKDCRPGVVKGIGSRGQINCSNDVRGPAGPAGCSWPYTEASGGHAIKSRIDISSGVSIECSRCPSGCGGCPPNCSTCPTGCCCCYNPGGNCNGCQHPICTSLHFPSNGVP